MGQVAMLQDMQSGIRQHLTARHLVGRSRNCHLCIPKPDVSAVHAAILWDGGVWKIQDFGSRNGTFINGHKVRTGAPTTIIT